MTVLRPRLAVDRFLLFITSTCVFLSVVGLGSSVAQGGRDGLVYIVFFALIGLLNAYVAAGSAAEIRRLKHTQADEVRP